MDEIEKWAPVPEWEHVYEVSSFGRVRRIKKNRCRTGLLKSCMLKNGYLSVHLRDSGREDNLLVHRIVLLAFRKHEMQNNNIANHKNGIRHDNRLSNLEWCDHSGNNLHAYRELNRKPVCNKGENAGRAKLTESDVIFIRAEYSKGNISQQKLADIFGVSQNLVSKIVLKQNWSHI